MEYIAEDIGYQMNPELHLPAQSINESVNEAVNSSLPQGNPAGSVNPMQLILFAAGIVWGLGMAVLMLYSVISLVRLKRRLGGAVRESERILPVFRKGVALCLRYFTAQNLSAGSPGSPGRAVHTAA